MKKTLLAVALAVAAITASAETKETHLVTMLNEKGDTIIFKSIVCSHENTGKETCNIEIVKAPKKDARTIKRHKDDEYIFSFLMYKKNMKLVDIVECKPEKNSNEQEKKEE